MTKHSADSDARRAFRRKRASCGGSRTYLREPHESAEHGEQRPRTTGLVAQDVLEGVGLERELQAGDVVAHLSCERHVGDGIDVLEVVGHVDVPRPAECEMVLRSTIRSSTERNC